MKIFRRVRKHLLKNKRIRNYFFYAIGEIILVVVGILLALQINTWNENRKKERLRDNYVKALVTDLKEDVSALRHRLDYEEEKLAELTAFQKRLSHPDATVDTLVKIARYELDPYIQPNFSFSNSTYTALIATGDIDLLDRELTESLNELNKYQKETNQTMEWASQLYQTYIGAYSMNYSMNLPTTIINKGSLSKDIWQNSKPEELAAQFYGVTGLKTNPHIVSTNSLTEVLELTREILEEVEE